MSALSNTFEVSSFKASERQNLKSSLDKEYKLLTANQSVFSNSKNVEREAYEDEQDKFWKEASIRYERKPSNKDDISPSKEGFKVNNNYYKHEIQNLRSSLNEMRDKAMKTKMMTSELRTTNTNKLEYVSDLEKERVKKLQAEREEEVAESLSHRERNYAPAERNPIDSAGKKMAKLAYQQKEKEVKKRVAGEPEAVKERNELENSNNWNSKGFNQINEEEREAEEVENGSNKKDQGYFTNKELVRAKYEQYEKDLLKKKEKSQQKKHLEERSPNEEPSVKKFEESRADRGEIVEEKQSQYYPVEEEVEDQRLYDRVSPERRSYNDDFSRALQKRERKLQEEYENIEREKSIRNRGLVYRETPHQLYNNEEDRPEHRVEYPTKKLPNTEFLTLELEKLKDENQRIKREIQDIQKRNTIQKRHYSAKLSQEDFQMSYYSPQDSLSGSRKLSKVKNQRAVEDKSAYSTVRKEEDIKKTISRARKSVHKKMENSKLEKSWKEARQRSTVSGVEDVFIGYKTGSRSGKFHAGTPVNHLRESAFLLAKGIPTNYVSNRNLNSLSQSVRSATSRSFRK